MSTGSTSLDGFEHVVVLMLENRSFDNLLGYLYEGGVPPHPPLGGTFEGVNPSLSNPDGKGQPVPVAKSTNYHKPYPDPGEEFDHVKTQLFGSRSQAGGTPTMQGFVADYCETLTHLKEAKGWPGSPDEESRQIMNCFDTSRVPVLSQLATDFAVFDHWFCAVPSQTWCNRAFWHADTSWGWVNNPQPSPLDDEWGLERWLKVSVGPTLFDRLEAKFGRGSWHVYSDMPLEFAFTKLIHFADLKEKHGRDYFRPLETSGLLGNFFTDCRHGNLPRYSFLEPHFVDHLEGLHWHDDMHPSSYDSILYGPTEPGTVMLGDRLIWRVYQAIRWSEGPSNWRNTLLIITFDEHGGCYDHVRPPSATPPRASTFNTGSGQRSFPFDRLGVRVPTVMVSAHIRQNTIVNAPMQHGSFLRTMSRKWSLESLGPRQDSAAEFTPVFTAATLRDVSDWPDWSTYPGPALPEQPAWPDLTEIALNELQKSYFRALQAIAGLDATDTASRLATLADARRFLQAADARGVFRSGSQ